MRPSEWGGGSYSVKSGKHACTQSLAQIRYHRVCLCQTNKPGRLGLDQTVAATCGRNPRQQKEAEEERPIIKAPRLPLRRSDGTLNPT